ncbi:MAG: nicotinamidase [Chitinivibrionales bacterium]
MAAVTGVNRNKAALLVIDVQYDFLPGGALAVEHGDEILEPIASIMNTNLFGTIVATQDWHPQNHISFAGRHEGKRPLDSIQLYGHDQSLWPDHCVQNHPNARIYEGLPLDTVDVFIRKGTNPDIDSYSAFRSNWAPDGTRPKTGLAGYLRDRGVEQVFVCGLARDVCVKWTCEDAADERFDTTILWDLSRSVDPSKDRQLKESLEQKKVRIQLIVES